MEDVRPGALSAIETSFWSQLCPALSYRRRSCRNRDRQVAGPPERRIVMKHYLLAVHSIGGEAPQAMEAKEVACRDVDAFNAELQSGGQWVFAGGLHPPETATVVRVQEDEVMMTDGPFSESKEQVGGFWVIKAPDLDAALASAVGASRACRRPVEVRPFQDDPVD
jgi:hypothetical protein